MSGSAIVAAAIVAVVLSACSPRSGPAASGEAGGGDFVVLRTEPANGATLFLNDPISIVFSEAVDLDTANLTTVHFVALDARDQPSPAGVAGHFRVEADGQLQGHRLVFAPRLPSNDDYSNGGFRAGHTYLVQLVGGDQHGGVTLRDRRGKALARPMTFRFPVRDGNQPSQLFRNPKAGGPTRTNLTVSTADDLQHVPLALFGAPRLEVRLHFDQALNPHRGNLPVAFDSNPLVRDVADRGRVYLEYDDPERNPSAGQLTWIPTDVELEQNDLTGAVLVLRPVGVLPNHATIRVIVEDTLEDIAGESNAGDLGYSNVFGTFTTESAYTQQWNGIVETFGADSYLDLDAVFAEPQAEVGAGFLRAGFAFEGRSTSLDYRPTANEVVLNTAFTQIVPDNGLPISVSGGVFNFRDVTIPQGVTVKGAGPNAMVWLCSGDFTVDGTLSVRGGDGARVDTLNSANVAKAGGVGICGGGNGGDGSPSAAQRDQAGATGRGPRQAAGLGGGGGQLTCTGGCYSTQAVPGVPNNNDGGGSGGGGGTLATQGDPHYRGALPMTEAVPNVGTPASNTAFQQRFGFGGAGCSGASGTRIGFLPGGRPGAAVFTDARADNDFWGSGVRLGNHSLRIHGELSVPEGGGGGGGGGDRSPNADCSPGGSLPVNDNSGGGGGGGGGVVIVKTLGTIRINATGRILADGGHGGGGEQAGSSGQGGGGGGGAGGMIVLMSARGIELVAHGSGNRLVYGATPGGPFLGDDYSFVLAADGGICTRGSFGGTEILSKYPANGATMRPGSAYDANPLGGFGGMGIVQLMVPPGTTPTTENVDGTNTKLDDNIHFYLGSLTGPLVSGLGKQQLLGWRGFQDELGRFVDDSDQVIGLGDNEGDIRPAPMLLPVPFGAKSRARSKWIDTGASQRRPLATAAGPRGLLAENGAVVGPVFEFAGLDDASGRAGYVKYSQIDATTVRIDYPLAVAKTPIAGLDSAASYLGQPAYRVTLAQPRLGAVDRYRQYEAELLTENGSPLASYRIVAHTDRELLLDPASEPLPGEAAAVQVRAKFFAIVTDTNEGLLPAIAPTGAMASRPLANLQIGFAFHQNPAEGLEQRFPANAQEFVHDLDDPALLAWVATNGAPRYVQWDVLFDLGFADQPLGPSAPRPELRYLRLPFRF